MELEAGLKKGGTEMDGEDGKGNLTEEQQDESVYLEKLGARSVSLREANRSRRTLGLERQSGA